MATAGDSDPPAIWMLAVGQTLGFACLYYSFGALLVATGSGTGWTHAQLSLGLTLALIVSALAVPFTGRLVDRGLGAELLTWGAALGGMALVALSFVTTLWAWYLAWGVVGLGLASCLYDTCFSFLTRRLGDQARAAIIRVTLVAGLASTLAFPLGAALARHWDWRAGYLVFGLMMIALTAPLNFYAGARLRRLEPPSVTGSRAGKDALRQAMRGRAFWVLAAIFGLAWMNHSILVTYFIPVFTGLGAAPALAVAAAATVGPFQVIGRIGLMLAGAQVPAILTTRAALAGLALASAVLTLAGLAPWLIFAFAVTQGAAIGMMSILRPVLIAEVLGRDGFGAISGAIATVPLIGNAAAPVLGAALLSAGGPVYLIAASLGMGALATGLTLTLPRPDRG